MRKGVLLIVLGLMAACTPAPTSTPAEEAITHWLGHPIAEVIAAWGAPQEERSDDGRQLYVWPATHYGRSFYPANLDPDQRLPFGQTPEELACRGVLEVDGEGIVTAAEWQGYECHHLP